ncbi:hypothetical protein V2J09_012217 [Rumex salicifolius]
MLQIRLNKGPSSDGGSVMKSLPAETVTVACPDHLVLADLPVAKGLGSATFAARVKTVGRRSRRQLGERVHFCVRCDFPIAIYGRLTPCEHVFCLDCARSDSICDDRIQKIQTIKLMEGIFICAAPHCLKSFLKKTEFESHIHGSHGDLLQPNLKKEEVNEFDAFCVKPSAASDTSSVRAPQKPTLNDRDDRGGRSQQSREQTPLRPVMQPRMSQYYGQIPNTPSDLGADGGSQRSDGFNRAPQQNFEASTDKQQQQGILSDPQHYPLVYYQQPPNFGLPINPGPSRPPFGFPPYASDGAPPFYGTPMNLGSDSTPDTGSAEQVSMPPPGFSEPHLHSWGGPFELTMQQQGIGDNLDPPAYFQGRNSTNKELAPSQVGNRTDSMPPPPPPGPPPPHLLQQKNDNYYSGEPSHDVNNYVWSQQNRD